MNIYGLLIGIGIYLGISQFQKKNTQISKNKQDKFIYLTIIFAILGARLYHVLDYWTYYSTYPIQIINLPAGGLGIFGALISSFIYISIFCYRNNINIILLLDLITPSLAIGQSIGRLGNYFNTEIFGKPTYIDFGQYVPVNFRPNQYINHSYFHPVWLYESILLFLVYLFIKNNKQPTAWYLLLFGLIRFSLDFLRFDTWTINHILISQIISLLLISIGTTLLLKKQTKSVYNKS